MARIGTMRSMKASSSARGAIAITSSESVTLTAAESRGVAPSAAAADILPSRSASVVGRLPDSASAIAAATVLLPVPPLPVTNKTRGSFIG